jgi:serine/threonine protein phosphatase PrpC
MRRHLSVEPDPFPPPRLAFRAVARSHPGLERPNNEDCAAIVDLSSAVVAVVCDGMGGEAGGEIASGLAVEEIRAALTRGADPARAVELAHARIRAEAAREPALARMGTTATVAAIRRGAVVCAQVGDSRAYLLRGGELFQLTRDQTLAELVRAGGLGDVSPDSIGAHVILQAVGSSARLEVAVTRAALEDGDAILLCSDGLHGVVEDAEIARILAADDDPAAACEALIARALAAGGPDNVTCVVLRPSL